MDPVALAVWALIAVVLFIGVGVALKVFGRLVLFLAGLAVLVVAVGMLTDPTATMAQVNQFVTQVNGVITQIKTSLGR